MAFGSLWVCKDAGWADGGREEVSRAEAQAAGAATVAGAGGGG